MLLVNPEYALAFEKEPEIVSEFAKRWNVSNPPMKLALDLLKRASRRLAASYSETLWIRAMMAQIPSRVYLRTALPVGPRNVRRAAQTKRRWLNAGRYKRTIPFKRRGYSRESRRGGGPRLQVEKLYYSSTSLHLLGAIPLIFNRHYNSI